MNKRELPPEGIAAKFDEAAKTKEALAAAVGSTGGNGSDKGHNSSERDTELGNAKRLVRQHGADIRYVYAFNAWFIWNGNFWQRDENGRIMRLAEATIESLFSEALTIGNDAQRAALRKFALKSQTRGQIENMVALARHQSGIAILPEDLDANPTLLGVLNGVIDLQTGELRKGRREDYITKCCNVEFDATAQCPNWIAFQEKITGGDKELIAYKQRLFGLTLSGLMVEVLFIMHGDGSNGKTTEAETIHQLLGDYACASDADLLLSAHNKGAATPDVVALKGRRAVLINETNESDHLNESRVKFITSNATLSGRDLHEKKINFAPTHKSFLQTNHRPRIRGTDLGMWRRIHYIPYNVTIGEKEKVEHFREEMLVPELSGILNWMIKGFLEYRRIGLKPPDVVCAASKEYRKEQDTLGKWIELAIMRVKGIPNGKRARQPLADLHVHYNDWMLRENGWPGVSSKKLAAELRKRGFESEVVQGFTVFWDIELAWEKPEHPAMSGGVSRFARRTGC